MSGFNTEFRTIEFPLGETMFFAQASGLEAKGSFR